jgi:hypothetical protein
LKKGRLAMGRPFKRIFTKNRNAMRILVFLLFWGYQSTAQQTALKQYYHCTNRAELYIVNNQWDSSLFYYRKALALNRRPFAKDLYNALLVACRIKQYPTAYQYAYKLAGMGYHLNNLRKDSAGNAFWQNSQYRQRLKKLAEKPPVLYDRAYRKLIEQMVHDDQYFRTKPGSYQLYDDTIRKIDRVNVFALQRLIATKGFPSEYRIGVDSVDLLTPLHDIIFIHQSSGPYQIINFSKEVRQAVLDGDIEQNNGAYLISRMDGYFRYSTGGFYRMQFDTVSTVTSKDTTYATEWGYITPDNRKAQELDSIREELMLEPLADRFKKEVFYLRQPLFLINANGYKSIYHTKDYQQFLYAQKNLVPIKL